MDNTTATVSRAVLLQQAIDNYTDYLVEQAEETISDERMKNLRNQLKLNQLSNLQSVVSGTGSINAVKNWIRYQMGRRETSRAWQNTGLGNDVLKRLDQMRSQAENIAQTLYADEATDAQVRAIHIALVRRYVGYMRRWFVAKGGQ
jgi:predicted RNA-binding protein